ncbi:hypothetical protein BVRB_6g150050 [Beta vulgaris subsp. vulgaris]|nr:hypothetical protein BVRB_6g150050 [Beta vulgaris subsp. vulgaris]
MIIHPQFIVKILIFYHLITTISAHLDQFYSISSCNTHNSAKLFTSNSQYLINLDTLLSKLHSQASKFRFYNYTVAFGDSPDPDPDPDAEPDPDQLYGLYQCREDVSLQFCSLCIYAAVFRIQFDCHLHREAIVWYTECMIRYANRPIFSLNETSPMKYVYNNAESDTNYTNEFDQTVLRRSMDAVINDAVHNDIDSKYYATRRVNLRSNSNQTLFCLAQCTPDIDKFACDSCLRKAYAESISCCNDSPNVAIFMPSCFLLYDSTRFFFGVLPPPLPHPGWPLHSITLPEYNYKPKGKQEMKAFSS